MHKNAEMKLKKTNIVLLFILLLSLAGGMICEYLYRNSPKKAIQFNQFQNQLISKELKASRTLKMMKQLIENNSLDSLIKLPFPNNDISFYVFRDNELIFWSDHNLEVSNIPLSDSTNLHFVQLPNAYCVSQSLNFDHYKLLSLIKIKNNFPYENQLLVNNFAKGFEMDPRVGITIGSNLDQYAVFSTHGDYLFSLVPPSQPIYNENFAKLGLIFFLVFFLCFFIFYARFPSLLHKKNIDIKTFVVAFLIIGLFVFVGIYFNFPETLYANHLFSPFQYAAHPFLSSIVHLVIITGYFIASICLFYFYVKINRKVSRVTAFLFQLTLPLCFLLLYFLLKGIVFHSGEQVNILNFKDFSPFTITIHILILGWGIGFGLLFYKIHRWIKKSHLLKIALVNELFFILCMGLITYFISRTDFKQVIISYILLCTPLYFFIFSKKRKNIYFQTGIYFFVFTVFFIGNSFLFQQEKKLNKYKTLAQNIFINGTAENDPMTEILLQELDTQLINDTTFSFLLQNEDSLQSASKYISNTYLRGFWNRYEIHLNAATATSALYKEYQSFVEENGTLIKQTHFFNIQPNEKNISHLGIFPVSSLKSDSLFLFIEFHPRQHVRSYSFPNLLISSTPDISTQYNISIARYENRKLVNSTGLVNFPNNSSWLPYKISEFYSFQQNHRTFYVYTPTRTTYLVITDNQPIAFSSYLFYFLYTFLSYYFIAWLMLQIYLYLKKGRKYSLGFTAKFQLSFIVLLLLSFFGIFYVSVNFLQEKYRKEQIQNLETKKNYIQKALQDKYYWTQELNEKNVKILNFDLQDLSYTYQIDIHVYNNDGILMASSQPLIFNKGLISNRIAPQPYFSENSNISQYESIGKLNYLVAYTDFYNGDYLQIGYIAVPQFFSQDEIKNEIESFMSVIIQIYLVIIILVILLTLLIGKQLSTPLRMLENKLKEMRIGKRNDKIDYKLNDEIGHLVAQYNLTVDQLEESARLLARSERESAWKSMARQIAHEINNPLTPMKLTIQQLKRTKQIDKERFDEYFAKSTEMLIEQIDNLSHIARTFSEFARMPDAKFEHLDVAQLLHSVVQLFSNNHSHIKISFLGKENGIYVYADPNQMMEVFNNLLKNALEAIPENREGKIIAEITETDQKITIKISDNGIGIPDEMKNKLFVPNFTTKNAGMGLGLAISKNIIELTGGSITYKTKLNEGTTFIISLPKEKNDLFS